MLKFVLAAFLFMGLAVNGQFEAEEKTVMNFNEVSEQSADEKAVNSRDESEESLEESSEEESDDESGAESFVSEDHMKEFDQNDDVGSKAMLEENSEEEQEDSSGWCGLSKCKSFMRMKNGFLRFRGSCVRCLRRRVCFRRCRRFVLYRKRGMKICMSRLRRIWNFWNRRLRANYKRISNTYKLMISYYTKAKLWNRRCRNKKTGQINALLTRLKQRKNYWKNKKKTANRYVVRYSNEQRYWARKYRQQRRQYYVTKWRAAKNNKENAIKARNYAANLVFRYNKAINIVTKWLGYRQKAKKNQRLGNAQKAKKARLLKRRKALFKARKRGMFLQRRRCIKTWYALRNSCAKCHARCGPVCWRMHVYYAHMVKQAHKCKIQKWFCGKQAVYKKYRGVFFRQCRYCLRKIQNRNKSKKFKMLVCSSKCGAFKKFALLTNYYARQCKN